MTSPPIGPAPGHPPGMARDAPPWFRAVTILYALVVATSALGSLSTIGGIVWTRYVVQSMAKLPGGGLAADMPQRMLEAQLPWLNGALAVVSGVVAAWALYHALVVIQGRGDKLSTFRTSALVFALVAVVVACGDAASQVLQYSYMQEVMADTMPKKGNDLTERFMLFGAVFNIAFYVSWWLVKIGLALYARHFVSKPEVRAYLGA